MNPFVIKRIVFMQLLVIFITCPRALPAADGFGQYATGGAGGINITVTNASDLIAYASSPSPYIITISGTILLTDNLIISSNKTIQGENIDATFIGNLRIDSGVRNVIIKNLNITNPDGVGEGDGITVRGGTGVIITHCTFTDCADGSIDVVQQADSVTISWCRFRYVQQTSHCYVNLIGNSDSRTSDLGYLHVTIHHCWYDANCVERMPSVRFGRVHVYNNYYNSQSISYGVRTRLFAECLVEGNYFENMTNPWELLTTSGTTGKLRAINNNVTFMDNSFGVNWISGWYNGQSLIPGDDSVFTPPYTYTPDLADDVKTNVMQNAGNTGNITGTEDKLSVPTVYILRQNYPNPFNPTTKIFYSVSHPGHVSIIVYDMLGSVVGTLVNEDKLSGNYDVEFNGSKLTSGIYYYQMKVNEFTVTKKMILLK